jgi:hypothetical protein
MKPTWAVELSSVDREAAQALRLVPGTEAKLSEDGTVLWLRGLDLDQTTSRLVRHLPCRGRFSLLEDGRAIPENATVPVVSLSGSGWVPLRHLDALELPPVKKPATVSKRARIRLVAATEEPSTGADFVILPFDDWHEYAVAAPAIRLSPLRFAVSDDGRAAIHGSPLPPLLGTYYSVDAGIAVPLGHALEPALPREWLARNFRLEKRDLLVFRLDGSSELLEGIGFSSATRSAVRATAESLAQVATE